MHLKRGDQLMSILLSVLSAVYWFNPVVWIAARLMRADMETACDGMVTRRLTREQRNDYASLILHLFAQPEHRRIVLGMAQSKTRKMAEQRVRGIYMRRSSGRGARAVCLLASLLLAFGCFTTACVPVAAEVAVQPAESGAAGLAVGPMSDDGAFTVTDAAGRTLRFTVSDLGASAESDTERPRGTVVSPEAAARGAAAWLVTAFADRVSDAALYVRFNNHADVAMEQYQILAGADTEGAAAFFCLMDAGTGDVLLMRDLTVGRNAVQADAPDMDDPRWQDAGEACLAAGKAYAIKQLTDGVEPLPDSYYDGVQATYAQADPLTAAVYLHMEQGACYTLNILYPSLTVTEVCVYPKGWDYCRAMTFYDEYMEEEAPGAGFAGGALTPDQYALIADAAIAEIGSPFLQPGLMWQSGPYTIRFVHMMIERALGGRASRGGTSIVIESANDPALGDNCVLLLESANPQEDIYAVYIGNGDYVYADPASQTIVARSLREDFGTRLISGTVINYRLSVPYRAFPSAEAEAEYAKIAARAAEMIGKKIDVRAQDGRNASYGLLQLLFGCDEPERDDDSLLAIWSVTDAALLPGKALTLYPTGKEVMEDTEVLSGICLGGSKYAMLNPDTRVVELRDLADDFARGLYSTVECCIVFDPAGDYRTIEELSQPAPTPTPNPS